MRNTLEVELLEYFTADYFDDGVAKFSMLVLVLSNELEVFDDVFVNVPGAIDATLNHHWHSDSNSALQDDEKTFTFLAKVAEISTLLKRLVLHDLIHLHLFLQSKSGLTSNSLTLCFWLEKHDVIDHERVHALIILPSPLL